MFKVEENPTFTIDVNVKVPVDGGHEDQTVKATFKVLSSDDAEAFDLTTRQGSTDFLDAIIVRLDDLADADGKPLSYNDKVKAQVCALPYARVALVRAYAKAVNEAARGN